MPSQRDLQELNAAKADLEYSVKVVSEWKFQINAARSDVSTKQLLDWRVLPPGQWLEFSHGADFEGNSPHGFDPSRLLSSDALGPNCWFKGSHLGLPVYLVALFDEIAVADTPERGNALYHCPIADWRSVLKRSKADALFAGARRIFHIEGWQERVRLLLNGP